MKKIFLLCLILFGFTACNNGAGPNGQLSANVRLYNPTKVTADGASSDPTQVAALSGAFRNLQMTKKQALQSLAAMRDSFRSSYIGYNLKEHLIGKSGEKIFAECANNINHYPATLTTLDYYDFMNECISLFKDTHLDIKKTANPIYVATVIANVMEIDGKIYIYDVRKALINKFEEMQALKKDSIADKIKAGLEIVSIDGKSPQLEIAKLQKFFSASSDARQKKSAINSLFYRNFSYPSKNETTIVVKQPDSTTYEITVPWVQYNKKTGLKGSLESNLILNSRHLVSSAELSADDKEDKNLLIESGNYKDNDLMYYSPLFQNIQNMKMYTNKASSETLLTGFVNIENEKYCYVKLNTFDVDDDGDTEYKVTDSTTKASQSVVGVLKDYLGNCEFSGRPLVFDLRHNNGGYARLADLVFALFETPSTPISYMASAYLINRGNTNALDSLLADIKKPAQSLTSQLVLKSLDTGSPQGDWVLLRQLKDTRAVFSGKVAVLISSSCISACEITANRFKTTGRGKLFGLPTAGTGFGFSGGLVYRDIHQAFTIDILNFAFQTPVVTDDSKFQANEDTKGEIKKFNELQLLENHPVQPDLMISPSYDDIFKDNEGYQDYQKKNR